VPPDFGASAAIVGIAAAKMLARPADMSRIRTRFAALSTLSRRPGDE